MFLQMYRGTKIEKKDNVNFNGIAQNTCAYSKSCSWNVIGLNPSVYTMQDDKMSKAEWQIATTGR